MRSFGHMSGQKQMQHATETVFRQAKLVGWAKALRLIVSTCFIAFCLVLLTHANATIRQSSIGIALLIMLFLTGIYDLLWIFRQRLFWNEHEIFDRGVFWSGKRQSWTNLTGMTNSMQRRATVLGFGNFHRLKIYWGYDGHREIIDFAERKLTDNA